MLCAEIRDCVLPPAGAVVECSLCLALPSVCGRAKGALPGSAVAPILCGVGVRSYGHTPCVCTVWCVTCSARAQVCAQAHKRSHPYGTAERGAASLASLAQDVVIRPRPPEAVGEQGSPPCLKCGQTAAPLRGLVGYRSIGGLSLAGRSVLSVSPLPLRPSAA